MRPIYPANTPEGLAYTPAVVLDPSSRIIFLGLIGPKRDGIVRPSVTEQTEDCFKNIEEVLKPFGPEVKVVKVTRLMVDVRELWTSQTVFDDFFPEWSPTSTLLEVKSCSIPEARIEFEVWAAAEALGTSQGLIRVPGPDGTLIAVAADSGASLTSVSGTADGAVGQGIVEELGACLQQFDDAVRELSQGSLVKLAIYLTDMRFWPKVKAAIARRYGANTCALVPAAVNKVQVLGASIQVLGDVFVPRESPAAIHHDPTKHGLPGKLLIISGSAALPVFRGHKAAELYNYTPEATIEAQTKVSMANYTAMLEAAGVTWDAIFRTTWYLTDLREWPKVESVLAEYFKRPVPQPTVVEIPKLVLPGIRIEPDMWARLP